MWSWRIFLVTLGQTVVVTICILCVAVVQAQVMTSGNYAIVSDSINVGGGNSSSTNYRQQSTFGEVGSGNSSSTNYILKAGYQQMQEVYLSMSGITLVTMSPALGGLTGGTSNGSTTVTIVTDNLAGYSLTIQASQAPAMRTVGGQTIANFPVVGLPLVAFSVAAGQAYFGFTPEGLNLVQRYKDNGTAVCGSGTLDTVNACWDQVSTTPQQIAVSAVANHPVGATTTLKFRVGIGANAGVIAGSYQATTTLTAVTL